MKNMQNKGSSTLQSVTDLFYKLNDDVDKLLLSNQNLFNVSNTDSINVRLFESRVLMIESLNVQLTVLNNINVKITDALNKTKRIHSQELIAIDNLLHKKNPNLISTEDDNPNQWAVVTGKKNTMGGNTTSNGKKIVPMLSMIKSASSIIPAKITKNIPITNKLSINAIVVESFNDVIQDGNLYYNNSSNHFAIKLNGHLFHGNIGNIYTDEKNPEKIKDCRFASSCMKHDKCDYYHDPVKFPLSNDRRNYIASSFLYTSQNGFYKNKERSRRFGSFNNLDIDIDRIQDDEISRFNDQIMHDILCAQLLNNK